MIRWKRWWTDISEAPPVDVLPASNGEFSPRAPTKNEIAVMQLQDETIEHWRRKMGMSRRQFVRTAMAYSIGFWAINQISSGKAGYFADAAPGGSSIDACDTNWSPDRVGTFETIQNLPGEFIFDVQSHHVESDGMWRVTNPGFEAFFAAIWSQAGPLGNGRPGVQSDSEGNPRVTGFGNGKEVDPIENLSRYHYFKELFLDSATTMTVLSAVPAAPDITQPLPIDRAAQTVQMVNSLAGSPRTVMHAFVMPNRGSAGSTASIAGQRPLYMDAEFDTMETRATVYKDILRGWKTYPAWGDVAYASGWFFDDELVGQSFIDHVRMVGNKYGVPKNIATHKGFALPGFDQRAASPRDIGPAASRNTDVNFIVYHSGFDGDNPMTAYGGRPASEGGTNTKGSDATNGDRLVNSADRTVSSLIKSLRENNWDATRFADYTGFGNVPNVYAEIGSTWRTVMGNASNAAHLLGKLIKYVGPKRICWGTDSLWFGSPHSEIVGLRKLRFTPAMNDFYGLADGIDSDADDPRYSTLDPASYTPTVASQHPDKNWPSDMKAHPERSIRNWIFGYAAARVYRVDASPYNAAPDTWSAPQSQWGVLGARGVTPFPAGTLASGVDVAPNSNVAPLHPIKCDDVQKIRDGYIINQMTPREEIPLASNTIIGARTPQELHKQRKEQPWGP